jgi:hypothetical protein
LAEFERVSAFWAYWILPMVLQQSFVIFPAMIAELDKGAETSNEEKKLPEALRYMATVLTSLWLFSFVVSQQLIMFWVAQPRAKKYSDGNWRLQYRPNKVPLMEASGIMMIEEMGAEQHSADLPENIVTDEGRFWDFEKLEIPSWLWVISGAIGVALACLFWSYRLLKHVSYLLWSYRDP